MPVCDTNECSLDRNECPLDTNDRSLDRNEPSFDRNECPLDRNERSLAANDRPLASPEASVEAIGCSLRKRAAARRPIHGALTPSDAEGKTVQPAIFPKESRRRSP